MIQEMTHFDEEGNARMVDVSDKDVTKRLPAAGPERDPGICRSRYPHKNKRGTHSRL